MGNYLNKPVTVKESDDMENGLVACGVSSMQGWRETQEDSHNCLIDFDDDVSLFAVYDGHGGAEVAKYAADRLPSFVKDELASKKSYKDALINAYLKFDDSLIEQSVVEKLTVLRGDLTDELNDPEEDEPLDELYEEAKLPIEDIILKYKKKLRNLSVEDITDKPSSSTESPNPETQEGSSSKDIVQCGTSNACSSKAITEDTSKVETKNGVDKIEPKENNEEAGGSSCIIANGTNDEQTNGTENDIPGTSKPECSSGSQEQNGSEQISAGTAYLIGDDASENDTSSDSEDELFEPAVPLDSADESEPESSESSSDGDSADDDDDDTVYSNSLLANLCGMDDDDDDDDDLAGKDSGCTAVMALLVKDRLYVANAGDSRCVVSFDGIAYDMSRDHKPEDEIELNRITSAGGRVSDDGRVNGGLNLSRALGDHKYKKNQNLSNTDQMITALPDVKELKLNSETNFMVLACDGIWNSLTSQEVVDFIHQRINKPDTKLSSICEELFDKCLAPDTMTDGTGCDNMTCIIVKLKYNNLKRSRTETEEGDSVDLEKKKLKTDLAENSDDVVELNKPKSDSAKNSDVAEELNKPKSDSAENSDVAEELNKSKLDSDEPEPEPMQ